MCLNRLNLLSGYRYPFGRFASLPPVNLFLFSLSFPLLHFRLSFKSFIIFAIAFHSVGWDRSQVQRRISWFEIREIMNNPREIKANELSHIHFTMSRSCSRTLSLFGIFFSPLDPFLLLSSSPRFVAQSLYELHIKYVRSCCLQHCLARQIGFPKKWPRTAFPSLCTFRSRILKCINAILE